MTKIREALYFFFTCLTVGIAAESHSDGLASKGIGSVGLADGSASQSEGAEGRAVAPIGLGIDAEGRSVSRESPPNVSASKEIDTKSSGIDASPDGIASTCCGNGSADKEYKQEGKEFNIGGLAYLSNGRD